MAQGIRLSDLWASGISVPLWNPLLGRLALPGLPEERLIDRRNRHAEDAYSAYNVVLGGILDDNANPRNLLGAVSTTTRTDEPPNVVYALA